MSVPAAVLKAPGTNCDRETAAALVAAGAEAHVLPLAGLRRDPGALDGYAILVLPGGFSYGDDLGAGRVLATNLRTHLYPAIARLVARGGLVLGICNGFQALVKAGLLPFGTAGGAAAPPPQTVTLAHNACGHFVSRWVHLEVATARSPWLEVGERLDLPVAHGEGRLAASVATLDRIEAEGLVALRYAARGGGPARGAFPDNPAGSARDLAGLCDPTGRILGLMPHPERNLAFHHRPGWTRDGGAATRAAGAGLRLFERAVRYAREAGLASAAAASASAAGGAALAPREPARGASA